MPTIAESNPGYANRVFEVALGGHAGGIGLMNALLMASGITYLAGGLLFGIALFRANILVRWAAALMAVASVATMTIPLFPDVNQRLFAVPMGIAMIGLGYSLWADQRSETAQPVAPPPYAMG